MVIAKTITMIMIITMLVLSKNLILMTKQSFCSNDDGDKDDAKVSITTLELVTLMIIM